MDVATGIELAKAGAELAGHGYALYSGIKRKRQEDANAAIPITSTGHETRGASVRKRFGRVSLQDRVDKSSCFVTYRWQAVSPYHSNYGAIPLVNNQRGGGTPSNTIAPPNSTSSLPIFLMDITSAPNVFGKAYARLQGDTSSVDISGIPVVNYNPAWIMNQQVYGFDGAVGLGEMNQQQLLGIEVFNKVTCQGPMGNLSDNSITSGEAIRKRPATGWQIKKINKPLCYTEGKISSTIATQGMYGLSPNATVQYGRMLNDVQRGPNLGLIPPVGCTPVHKSVNVDLCLVGCRTIPVEYDISLISIKKDHLHPDYNRNLNIATGRVPDYITAQSLLTQADGTTAATTSLGYPAQRQQYENDDFVRFWSNFAGQYCLGPGNLADKSIYKDVVVVGKRRVRIEPPTTIDKDTTPIAHNVSLKFDFDTVRNYCWSDNTGQTLQPTYDGYTDAQGNVYGVPFVGDFKSIAGAYPTVDYNSRLYLCIRARYPQTKTANQNAWDGNPDLSGTGAFNFGATDVPTFDIAVDSTFEIDRLL